MSKEGYRLDPQDWDAFGADMHQLLDDCLGRMANARDLPWQPPAEDLADRVALAQPKAGQGAAQVFDRMVTDIMPYATGNTHPGFFGWVHGTGLPVAVGAEMVAATMNSNCGGRNHAAAEVERSVINWLCKLCGLPEAAFGILTSGTSQATILALAAARMRLFGRDIRKDGVKGFPDVAVYIVEGGHSCVEKALEVLGHGANALRHVGVTTSGQMDLADLCDKITEDRARGVVPLAVVGTAGSVNLGVFDPLQALGEYCQSEGIWLHVDAAFGFWTLLADKPWSDLPLGIELAQSVACDFHKWMSIPYDCGACLISDRELHRQTFSSRPSYLASSDEGLAGGDLWFCDYGLELSRGFKALKVWATVNACGTDALGAAVTDNCKQAALMAQLVEASPDLELARPVVSNLCCFWTAAGTPADIATRLQLTGEAVFSTTIVDGRDCLRAAIVGHRTTQADIRKAISAVEREVRALR